MISNEKDTRDQNKTLSTSVATTCSNDRLFRCQSWFAFSGVYLSLHTLFGPINAHFHQSAKVFWGGHATYRVLSLRLHNLFSSGCQNHMICLCFLNHSTRSRCVVAQYIGSVSLKMSILSHFLCVQYMRVMPCSNTF